MTKSRKFRIREGRSKTLVLTFTLLYFVRGINNRYNNGDTNSFLDFQTILCKFVRAALSDNK